MEEKTISPLSPMPANVADQVAEADFYHLLGFLLAQKPAASEGPKNSSGLQQKVRGK